MAEAKDKQLVKYEVPLNGKLITSEEPCKIGPNFQQLTNMRYGSVNPKGIAGMTKINTAVMNATYLKTRSGIHFKKNQPAESHVLVDAFNTGLTASRVLQNTTAIPSAGAFSATTLYTPTSTSPGRWSLAPDGDVARCDGENSTIWGGTEREIAAFINHEPNGDFSYDFTEQLRNTKTDSANVAPLKPAPGYVDANTLLLCHFDNNDDDSSPTTAHTLTPVGTITYSTTTGSHSVAAVGTHCARLTTDGYFTIPDNADFDFSGGVWTLDAWFYITDDAYTNSLFYQFTTNDDDSLNVIVDGPNKRIIVRLKAGGTKQFSGGTDFATPNGSVPWSSGIPGSDPSGLTHVAVVENNDNWYIFINGQLQAYTSDAARAANYTGVVSIGQNVGGCNYFEGDIDEYRISNSARWTSGFETQRVAYGSSQTQLVFDIAAIRPLDGFKLYVSTANNTASTMVVSVWNGDSFAQVSSLVDGTSASSKSLAQTGTVTFTSTAATAELRYFEGVLAYWYRVNVTASGNDPALYHVTCSTPFQDIKDIWDGVPRLVDSFQIYKGSYTDATLNVRENEYDSLNTGTFIELDSLSTAQWFICGFSEKACGVVFNFVNGKENTTSTIMSVDFWNGDDWESVSALNDGTLGGNVSMSKNGAVVWGSPTSEFRQAINPARSLGAMDIQAVKAKGTKIRYKKRFIQSANSDTQLYYYRFSFSAALHTDVQVYHIYGIPAQEPISSFKFPFFANDRLWLCSDQKGKKNSAICSADGSSCVFNGDDALWFEFGDDTELTGAAWLFSSVGSNIFNVMMFFKPNETWAIIGNGPDEWVGGKYRISSVVGCVAPETIKVVDTGTRGEQSINKTVVVWQASDGIYVSDGRTPVKISDPIDDKFDQLKTGCINSSKIDDSTAFWDNNNKCYHWLWASGSSTVLDQEWVFDFKKMAWFNVDRGTAKDLQYGIEVQDTYGNMYNYGFIETGYMERLEYGTTFDGNSIDQTFWIGDNALVEGSIVSETIVEYTCLIAKAKSTTTNSITLTHYGDGNTTGDTAWTESPQKSGYNIIYPVEHHSQFGASIFHSIKATLSTSDENCGFEPLYLYMLYSPHRNHIRDYK